MSEEKQFLGTIARAKENNVGYIWSGELRNAYLRKCLKYAKENDLVHIEEIFMNQESGYRVTWL